MNSNKKEFLLASKRVAFDIKHRNTIYFNISKYEVAVFNGKARYSDINLAKSHAAQVKRHVVANLPYYLQQFEKSAIENGVEVLWASDADEANEYLKQIIISEKVKKVVKSKSMTSEELSFNEVFSELGIDCIETDLGEFIVQKAGEKPYHILTPAMHKSRADVGLLFNKLYGISKDSTALEMTTFVRNTLRCDFENADMGLTGANFLISKEGCIALTENEGNGLFSLSHPRIHVVLAGIEKLLPSIEHLDLFWPLLAVHGTGQRVTAYNSLVFGPKQKSENDGPERMIVILLDNGRSKLYNKPVQSEALSCIRCGACLNACPIYKNVGGYTYNCVYSGPIGSVITPHLKKFTNYSHLSHACSLCGKCYEVCPVKINLPQLLLENRRECVENRSLLELENVSMNFLGLILKSSKLQSLKRPTFIKKLAKVIGNRFLGEKRKFPSLPTQSFRLEWKNMQLLRNIK